MARKIMFPSRSLATRWNSPCQLALGEWVKGGQGSLENIALPTITILKSTALGQGVRGIYGGIKKDLKRGINMSPTKIT